MVGVDYRHAADLPRARREVVEICRSMHQRGLIAAGDGNVSVRIGDRKLLVTPSGARKGFMEPGDPVLTDLDGAPLPGERRRPSSELAMHLAIYTLRPEVRAVVHAHPPCAIAHTIAEIGLDDPLLPEAAVELGDVLTLPYTTPGTEEVPNAIRRYLGQRVALVMARHGSITVGPTLAKAYDRLEVLEHSAKISLMARQLAPGRVRGLGPEELAKL